LTHLGFAPSPATARRQTLNADPVADLLSLLDWKRRIAELYAQIVAAPDARGAWALWQATRARMFREHPQSPVPIAERGDYGGPHLFDYDPTWRLEGSVEAAEGRRLELPSSDGAVMVFRRFGFVHLVHGGSELGLEIYWLESYGGGLFVPFADATSGHETYGAGRYLLDTVKGAYLGEQDGQLVMDFNFAYQPSCSYDPRWTCPLTPPANRLRLPVRAGERVAAP
jgi:uncharacterized protein